jgi:hypothetical protein
VREVGRPVAVDEVYVWHFAAESRAVDEQDAVALARRRYIGRHLTRHESRHKLARHVFHGRKGQLRQAYREGMEDQLGAQGRGRRLVLPRPSTRRRLGSSLRAQREASFRRRLVGGQQFLGLRLGVQLDAQADSRRSVSVGRLSAPSTP